MATSAFNELSSGSSSANYREFKTNPTNTPPGFHVEKTWKWSFPRRFNVESMWCVCREVTIKKLEVNSQTTNLKASAAEVFQKAFLVVKGFLRFLL